MDNPNLQRLIPVLILLCLVLSLVKYYMDQQNIRPFNSPSAPSSQTSP